jgi:hypothetical protein
MAISNYVFDFDGNVVGVIGDIHAGHADVSDIYAANYTNTSQFWPQGIVEAAYYAVTSSGSAANQGTTSSWGGQFQYQRGSNVTAIGQFVHIQNGSAVLLDQANSLSYFPVGVAAGPLSATNVFGWVQVDGYCDYAVGPNSSVGAGVPLYMGGTAGRVAASANAGQWINGLVAPVSYTSSQSRSFTVQMNYPSVVALTGASNATIM